jgi:hypothetical protein
MSERLVLVGRRTHLDIAVFEAFSKHFLNGTFVLFFDDAWNGGEYPKSTLSHPRLRRLACLEQGAKQLYPYFVIYMI